MQQPIYKISDGEAIITVLPSKLIIDFTKSMVMKAHKLEIPSTRLIGVVHKVVKEDYQPDFMIICYRDEDNDISWFKYSFTAKNEVKKTVDAIFKIIDHRILKSFLTFFYFWTKNRAKSPTNESRTLCSAGSALNLLCVTQSGCPHVLSTDGYAYRTPSSKQLFRKFIVPPPTYLIISSGMNPAITWITKAGRW